MLSRRELCSLLRSSASSARVGGSGAVAGRRGFTNNAQATATDAAHQEFIAAWKKVVPNSEPPKTPLTFMKPRPMVPGSIPTKLTVNFVLPYQVELSSKEVSSLLLNFPVFLSNRGDRLVD